MEVYIVVFDPESTMLSAKISARLEEYIDENYVEEKSEEEYFGSVYDNANYSDIFKLDFEDEEPESSHIRERGKSCGGRLRRDVCEAEPCYSAKPAPKADSVAFTADKKINPLVDEYGLTPEAQAELQKRLDHLSDTFSQYLMFLISEKKLDNPEVYNGSCVDKKTFSKIKNNEGYHPKKLTALCLCIGAKLNLDQSKDLLQKAGYAFSDSDMTDIIFRYFIEKEIYDIIQVAIELENRGLQIIIRED